MAVWAKYVRICVCVGAWTWAYAAVGVDQPAPPIDSFAPIGSLSVHSGRSVLTVLYNGANVAHLTLDQDGEVAPRDDTLSLSDRLRCCSHLCRSGLGGSSCGKNCDHLVPAHFLDHEKSNHAKSSRKFSLHVPKFPLHSSEQDKDSEEQSSNKNDSVILGRPRFEVCPVLCDNNLGQPICGCNPKQTVVNWMRVCEVFCESAYRLNGCPECKEKLELEEKDVDQTGLSSEHMQDIWLEWCQLQCRKGDGGAACNCDMAPLMEHV